MWREGFGWVEGEVKGLGRGMEVRLVWGIGGGWGVGRRWIVGGRVVGGVNDLWGVKWEKEGMGRGRVVVEEVVTRGGGWEDE